MAESAEFDTPNIAEKVVERFGGLKAMAELTGYKETELRSWCRYRRTVPEEARPNVLRVAARTGVDVTPWTFIEHLIAVPA